MHKILYSRVSYSFPQLLSFTLDASHHFSRFLLRSYSLLGGGCVLGTGTVAYISFRCVRYMLHHSHIPNQSFRSILGLIPRLRTEPKTSRLGLGYDPLTFTSYKIWFVSSDISQ